MIYLVSNTIDLFNSFPTASMLDVVEYCKDKSILGVDTETTGIGFMDNNIVMFQIGDAENQFVIDSRHLSIEPLKEILESLYITKVFHNVKFDYKFIKKQYGIRCTNVYDTMLVDAVIHCGREISLSLKAVSGRYGLGSLDKEVRLQFTGLDEAAFTVEQVNYGAKDVALLPLIMEKQLKVLEELSLNRVAVLENAVALAFAEMEFNGMEFDKDKWLENASRQKEKLLETSLELDSLVEAEPKLSSFVAKYFQSDMFKDPGDIRKVDILWSSPLQVLKVFQAYGLNIDSVNEGAISKYRSSHGLISKYLEYKETQKAVSTYGESFLKYIHRDGKVRTIYHQIMDTGRVSSGDKSSNAPNLQNIPADNSYRSAFHASEGYVYVAADYASQELRIIASGSKDPVWGEAVMNGWDLHSVSASLVFGDKWRDSAESSCSYYVNKSKCDCKKHKQLRTFVKTINFGLA
jgi:DNA polymerase I